MVRQDCLGFLFSYLLRVGLNQRKDVLLEQAEVATDGCASADQGAGCLRVTAPRRLRAIQKIRVPDQAVRSIEMRREPIRNDPLLVPEIGDPGVGHRATAPGRPVVAAQRRNPHSINPQLG